MEIPGFRREDLGTVVRYSPMHRDVHGLVCFTRVSADELGSEIRRHMTHFKAMNIGFEWKVYDSDTPESLRRKLIDVGFEQGEVESIMVYDVARFRPTSGLIDDGVELRRIENIAVLKQIVEFQEIVWSRSFGWLNDQLRSIWDRSSFYAAYQKDDLVGVGWIEYPEASQFAELHGGAVLPAFRGRRIYSRLFEARMLDALGRGVRCVAVDAAPMSRPILEAKGFERLDTTYPMTWTPQPSGACA
jgi:N-acetylglutamate synthase-like GNAT family acetyltransferase